MRTFLRFLFGMVVAGQTAAFAQKQRPSSPWEMAVATENWLVEGAGARFLPGMDGPAREGDSFAFVDESWPDAFQTRVGKSVYLRISQTTGRYEFMDADGVLFWTVVPDTPLTQDWITPFLSPLELAAQDLYSPFRLVREWRLTTPALEAMRVPPRRSAPRRSALVSTNLCFTSLSIANDVLFFTADWPESHPLPDELLDLYAKTNLLSRTWSFLSSHPATNKPASFSIPMSDLPWQEIVPHVHDTACDIRTNLVASPLDENIVYTNIVYGCGVSNLVSQSVFFNLGTRADTDGDGLTDAFELFVSLTNPDADDSDGDSLLDGAENAIGTNPLDWDTDDDGLSDGTEACVVYTLSTGGWIDTASWTNRVLLLSQTDDGVSNTILPFPFFIYGASSNLSVNANGLVRFSDGISSVGSNYGNSMASAIPLSSNGGVTIAAFWDDLKLYSGLGSNVTLATSGEGTNHVGIIEFNHTGFHNVETNQVVSFQVQFWEEHPDRIRVVFSETAGLRGGGQSATLGARWEHGNIEYAYDTPNSVFPGLCLEYRFGIGTDSLNPDTDGDGLLDGEENVLGTNPFDSDTDSDGIWDQDETLIGTDPVSADTDGDGLSDSIEIEHDLSPNNPEDALTDADGDGLTLRDEVLTHQTNPSCWDTDYDGLSDGYEMQIGTNPTERDSDGDGMNDGTEVSNGFDPCSVDTDADGMPDGWEAYYGFNPLADDASLDADNDGLSNRAEYEAETIPVEPDTDEDGLLDGEEIGRWEYASTLPNFSYTNVTNLISSSSNYDDNLFLVSLPFEVQVAGYRATKILLSVNGFVWLVTDKGKIPTASDYGNQNLSNNTRSPYHGFIAAYWDDLYAYAGHNARLSVSEAFAKGQRFCEVKYQNISRRDDCSIMGSFRIIIPEDETSTVVVAYDSLSSGFNGADATIGAQSPNRGCNFPVAYNESASVTNGMIIVYRFGTGSNPLAPDTDGDGMEDDDEAAIGTIPIIADTDCDGLLDGWEYRHGLDPLYPSENNGAGGDPDGDHLSNAKEAEYGTNPCSADTDLDGLEDNDETGCIFATDTVPWLEFDESEDITEALSLANRRCVNWSTPPHLTMQGEVVTNITISANGILFFNRAGYENHGTTTANESFRYKIDDNALVLAPYLENTYFRTDIPGLETSVKVGTSTYNGEGYLLVEFDNAFCDSSVQRTNAISFQVSIPANRPACAFVRYKNLSSQFMTGNYASIGMQTFDSRWLHSYCYSNTGKIWENLCLEFRFGENSDPHKKDFDEDGLSDGLEASIGTSPAKADTDADGLTDFWEFQNNFNPLSAIDDNGAFGDPDGDGMDNYAECELGTNPHLADTDNDGLDDGEEAVCVSFADPLPWLETSVLTNLTEAITNASRRTVSWNLPSPVLVQGETITNLTLNARGIVCLNHMGYSHPDTSHSPSNLQTQTIDTNAFVISAYGGYLDLYETDAASAIKIGTAEYDGMGYLVVEYDNLYPELPSYTTNAISFQVAIPTGRVDRVGLQYRHVVGPEMDGRNAVVGCQSFGADDRVSYCCYEQAKIYDGMCMSFMVGYGTNPLVADTDEDGISDGVEVKTCGSNPKSVDTDLDGLTDAQETTLGTIPSNPDSDGDGLQDGWERANSFNSLSAPGNGESGADTDGDGLSNLQEQIAGCNPRNADSDGDGLSDSAEFLIYRTNPLVADTDDDGMTDKQETDKNCDPLDSDMDRDGMPDGWENAHGLDPKRPTGDDGADGDSDNDGLSNINEYLNGTNPNLSDSDGDGVTDSVEVANGSNPNDVSDGGQVPPFDLFREIEFNINGDYAAWEMTIKGLGPDDTRTRKISMGRPNANRTTNLRMRKGNAYRLSMRWLNCDGHHGNMSPWYCWLAQLDGVPSGATFSDYSETRRAGNEIVAGNGWIADNADGLLTSHVHASATLSDGSSGGGNIAERLTATLYVLDDPKLIPDYNRDGTINDEDKTKAEQGKILRFWINDDEDDEATNGKYAELPYVDIPGARTGWFEFDWRNPDWNDAAVNGHRDLIDFTPVFMDVSPIHILPAKIRNNLTFKLKHESKAVNVIWTGLSKNNVGVFQKVDAGVYGRDLMESATEASVNRVEKKGIEVPDALAEKMKASPLSRGVLYMEGCFEDGNPLELDICYNNRKVVSGELPLSLSSVEEMYWFHSIRGAENDPDFPIPNSYSPGNLMENPVDIDLFFTHGFNVNEEAARGWGAEVFKRLWQSGSNARFHMVAWSGDFNWTGNWANGFHYHQDVYQALKSGNAFKRLVEREQGDSSKRIVMAHSLGNMMACEAFRQGLVANQYFMFDAAIASEAMNASYQDDSQETREKYVPTEWLDYHPMSWTSNWHKWFKDDPTDMRGKMGWPDYFKDVLTNVLTVYNYYSSGDPVFIEKASIPDIIDGVFHWPTLQWLWPPAVNLNITTESYCWQKQESHKGIDAIAGTLAGGWGFFCWEEYSDEWLIPMFYPPVTANSMVADGSVTNNPVFSYPETQLTNRRARQDDIWYSLASYIPAISSPVGGRYTAPKQVENHDLNGSSYRCGWGRSHNIYREKWLHSDMKDMAFYYIYMLYNEIISKGNLK